jgi:hypothetical protein
LGHVIERQQDFELLQRRLRALWPSIAAFSEDPQTVVVVPSYSVDPVILRRVGHLLPAYEERFLYMLLLLRQPACRIVFVTSVPVRTALVDAYLSLIPGIDPAQARSRLFLLCAEDAASRPLAEKLLVRGDLIAKIDELVPDRARAHLAMFNVTEAERDLALALDLPIFGAAPHHSVYGTKAGCRRLFAEEDVPHPSGETVTGKAEATAALGRLRSLGVATALLKLNEGVSGLGNVMVDLDGLPSDADDEAVSARLESIPPDFFVRLAEQGGVVEELIVRDDLRSPSAQLRVTPFGEVELLSTHDQLLGGPTGQTYIGCRFPADTAYAPAIAAEAMKIGRRLAREGVQGRFAVDFVVARAGASWDAFAIEINLRKGGTTHPFLTLQFLTGGSYDGASGVFLTPEERAKFYLAVDGGGHHDLAGVTAEEVLAAAADIAYDPQRQSGVVLHMLSALDIDGKFGFTAIADSPEEADVLRDRAAGLVERLVKQRARAVDGAGSVEPDRL